MRWIPLFLLTMSSAALADELNCLALNIYHEARGEPPEGQEAVAAVTMNRVKDPNYPSTVCAVVWQPLQFSWTLKKQLTPTDPKAWDNAVRLASKVLKVGAKKAIVGGATHYYSTKYLKEPPKWASSMMATRVIGNHVFFRKHAGGT